MGKSLGGAGTWEGTGVWRGLKAGAQEGNKGRSLGGAWEGPRGQLDRDHGEGGTREGAGAWEGEGELEGAGSWEGTAQHEPLRSMSMTRGRNQGG